MNRGFYTLGSGMLTSNRALSTISNNITNVATIGFKKSDVLSSTFGDMLMYRLDDDGATSLGSSVSMIRSAAESVTIHSQGTLETTDRALDFAISGAGFFAVQSNDGVVYTRNGNFSIDEQGYLTLDQVGRVLGENGPIRVNTDDITADSEGNISADSALIDKIAVYDFKDYNNLVVVGEGMYGSTIETPALAADYQIAWKSLEKSNVDTAEEMTDAIATQRNLQACAQALQMYDQNLAKAVSEIGKV